MPNTAKQEAIRKAYGEYWELFTPTTQQKILDNNGKVDYFLLTVKERNDTENIVSDIRKLLCVGTDEGTPRMFIPQSLQGIENNNGWIRIESEEDLPNDSGDYWVYETNGVIGIRFFMSVPKKFGNHETEIEEPKITHYQPIVKPEKPIY